MIVYYHCRCRWWCNAAIMNTMCRVFYYDQKAPIWQEMMYICTRVSILYFLNSSTVVLTYSVRWKLQNLQDKCYERSLINLLLADCDSFAASKAEVFKFTVPDIMLYFLLTFCDIGQRQRGQNKSRWDCCYYKYLWTAETWRDVTPALFEWFID